MRTVQMTLDENLVKSVDEVVRELNTTRSAFTRDALQDALKRVRIAQLEAKHRKGYEKYPVTEDEFGNWEDEQDWGG
ncbi:MAG: ribbon-helix-helix domain-containing protein [Dehalococcoidia bacterium]